MTTIEIIKKTKAAWPAVRDAGEVEKNKMLLAMADELEAETEAILSGNREDVEAARGKISEVMLDRLALTAERIHGMAEGIREIAELEDHTGRVLSQIERPNGMKITKKQVPLGLVAIIYESRPNVTSDAAALALKSGNVCVLRGGKEAFRSANAIVNALKKGIEKAGGNPEIVNLLQDMTRESANELMRASGLVDLLIPRGGAGLIKAVVNQATIPVIETGTGNCHIFVDETADFNMALDIIMNAKTQRIGVCNACESLVLHEKIADAFVPALLKRLAEKEVEVHGDEKVVRIADKTCGEKAVTIPATEEDWGKEYLDYKISAKTVASLDEAIAHINQYNTGHSEAIITQNYENAQRFLNEIDAACVYVNASTRFTDGFEFGFGAEIGISTQKLHARGPMGLDELCSYKYVIHGNGQIR